MARVFGNFCTPGICTPPLYREPGFGIGVHPLPTSTRRGYRYLAVRCAAHHTYVWARGPPLTRGPNHDRRKAALNVNGIVLVRTKRILRGVGQTQTNKIGDFVPFPTGATMRKKILAAVFALVASSSIPLAAYVRCKIVHTLVNDSWVPTEIVFMGTNGQWVPYSAGALLEFC